MNKLTDKNNESTLYEKILNLYRESVNNVPILKYSWVLITTISILALTAFFKLKNPDVFLYAFLLMIISFFGFLFSYLLRKKDKIVRIAIYILIYSIVVTLVTLICSFGYYIVKGKPDFYNRYFSDQNKFQKIINKYDTITGDPSINGILISESAANYLIETKVLNPLKRDLLVKHIKITKKTVFSIMCNQLISPYYILADEISIKEKKSNSIRFKTWLKSNKPDQNEFFYDASGSFEDHCAYTILILDLDVLFELTNEKYTTFYINIPKNFLVKDDKTQYFNDFLKSREKKAYKKAHKIDTLEINLKPENRIPFSNIKYDSLIIHIKTDLSEMHFGIGDSTIYN